MRYATSKKSRKTTVVTAAMINMSPVRSRCSLYPTYDRHLSKSAASLCAMFSFISCFSPAVAANLPAKKRVWVISQILFFARMTQLRIIEITGSNA
jgi:hypothetical protein